MQARDETLSSVDGMVEAVEAGDRVALARAITLVESVKPEDQTRAQALLDHLLPLTGNAMRVGISGVPGAGKSTLIDQLGFNLVAQGHKVAVLAVDPTSSKSGGSILGDKTRMGRLATETGAFIRPSPAGDSLGGVTKTTRETIALVEAAGYDVVLVETVGVGQSEMAVANMVDVFVVVALPGAGDELQGIKRGLLELADIIAVNKADGDNIHRAERAALEYRAGLHILAAGNPDWSPVVLTVSARENIALDELWQKVEARQAALASSGALAKRRSDQAAAWMRELFEQRLLAAFRGSRRAARHWSEMEAKVRAGEMTPSAAAAELARLAEIGPQQPD
jgi:GTPase